MEVITTVGQMKEIRKNLEGSLGFVPTMGYLHEGHLTLVRKAKEENDFVAASIFVNPTQFGPNEDFEKYPRDEERDLELLLNEGCDFVYFPSVVEMYPPGFATYVTVEGLTTVLEGASRPTHFRGVTTVVNKLFNIVQPTKAYFGQKDAQQVVVIQKMAKDLDMNLEVIVVPTVREDDGLAMSSRNVYLKPAERKAALALSRSLREAEKLFADGERDAGKMRETVLAILHAEPLLNVDYVSIADRENLQELNTIGDAALLSLASRVGVTRLIDNTILSA